MIGNASTRLSGRPQLRVPRLLRQVAPDAGPAWWRVARWPVALLFAVFGVVVILSAILTHLVGVASESWPTTTGQVVEATIRESRKTTTKREVGRRTYTIYRPEVRYAYTVDGRTYQSDAISLEVTTYRTRGEAAVVIARYPEGASVPIFYNPARPEWAVLEPGWDGGDTLLGFVIGLGSIGGGLLFLRVGHVRLLQVRRTPSSRRTRPTHQTMPKRDRS